MSASYARFRLNISLFCTAFLGIFVLNIFCHSNDLFAGEFDELLGEAIEHGTSVDAARSRKEAAEIGVRRAWAKFLPSIEAYGEFGHTRNNSFGRLSRSRNSYDNSVYGLSASVPIFRGGTNYYGLKEAKASATAEQHGFKEARQILLLDTVRAILGVIRDRRIVALQRENQQIVHSIWKTTQRRYEGGEATRTDIAVAHDQFTAAQADYTQALNELRSNETEFIKLIGRKPNRLPKPTGVLRRLPKSLKESISLAESQNPLLLSAIYRSEAADHAVKSSYGGFLPSVDLDMDYSEERFHGDSQSDDGDFSVKLNFTVPLFKPDVLPATEISQKVSDQRRFEVRDARLTAGAMATVAWRSYHSAAKQNQLARTRIRAAEAAAVGMRRELEAGQRTVLDVLDTQERLVTARVQAANTEFERYMSAHLLLSSVGQLDEYSNETSDLNVYSKSAEKTWRERADVRQSKREVIASRLKKTEARKPRKIHTARVVKKVVKKIKKVEKPKLRLASLDETYVVIQPQKIPEIPVLKITEPSLVKTKIFKAPSALRKSAVKPGKPLTIVPLRRDPLFEKKPSSDRKVKPVLRRGIYGLKDLDKNLEKNMPLIVTGSLAKKTHKTKVNLRGPVLEVHKIATPPQKVKSQKSVKFHKNAKFHKSVRPQTRIVKKRVATFSNAASNYFPPLPRLKYQRDALGRKIVEYPDTMNNRMALWWNNNVDSLFGQNVNHVPVLVRSN